MKKLFTLIFAVILFACATPEQIAARQAKQNATRQAISENSVINCDSKKKCDAIYRVAVDMVTSYSDMKIQTQGENNISTYNPIDYGRIGMSATRTLSSGTAEKVTLNVYCKGMSGDLPWESCFDRVTSTYNLYRAKIDAISEDKKNNAQKPNK